MQMVGDWEDVGPAALVAASQCEMAIVRWPETVPGSVREMELVTTGDEPAELRFEAASSTDPRPMEVLCKVGTYGDVARERDLLDRVSHRLEQLKGKDWAPVEP
ncbi:MAG: hypothetical protein WC718_14635 [Phycisphaerales bacterium]|jgi:hypothetical protein